MDILVVAQRLSPLMLTVMLCIRRTRFSGAFRQLARSATSAKLTNLTLTTRLDHCYKSTTQATPLFTDINSVSLCRVLLSRAWTETALFCQARFTRRSAINCFRRFCQMAKYWLQVAAQFTEWVWTGLSVGHVTLSSRFRSVLMSLQ